VASVAEDTGLYDVSPYRLVEVADLLPVSCVYVNVLYHTSGVEQNEAVALSTVVTVAEMTYALRVHERGSLCANVTKNYL